MQFAEILKSDEAFQLASRIDKIILGGEDVRPAILKKIQLMKNEVYLTFGMTETISHIALRRLNGSNATSYYRTLPGIIVQADENKNLVIGAPLLGQAHLRTNDAVQVLSDNEFEWLGRTDNVVNTGGVKIHPEEVEKQLAHAIDRPYFIGGIPDNETGEKLVLMIEAEKLSAEEQERIKAVVVQLEKLHRPKVIFLLPEFKRTGTGKIIRKENLNEKTIGKVM
jgi:O-succinylbenzoic acid--CoA ligase